MPALGEGERLTLTEGDKEADSLIDSETEGDKDTLTEALNSSL